MVQVERMMTVLRVPGSERSKLKYEKLLSNFAFSVNCAATCRRRRRRRMA